MLNNVPLPGNNLQQTRDPINNNFSVIDTAFSVNHVPYNDASGNQGMHQFMQIPAAVPTLSTVNATPIVGFYSNNGATSGVPELFFQRTNQAANTGYAFTEGTNAQPGWSRLGSGIVLKWGAATTGSGAGNTFIDVNLDAVGVAYANTPYAILLTPVYTAGGVIATAFAVSGVPAPTQHGFRIIVFNTLNNAVPLNWLTIGI